MIDEVKLKEILKRGKIDAKLYTWGNMDDYNFLLEVVKELWGKR